MLDEQLVREIFAVISNWFRLHFEYKLIGSIQNRKRFLHSGWLLWFIQLGNIIVYVARVIAFNCKTIFANFYSLITFVYDDIDRQLIVAILQYIVSTRMPFTIKLSLVSTIFSWHFICIQHLQYTQSRTITENGFISSHVDIVIRRD